MNLSYSSKLIIGNKKTIGFDLLNYKTKNESEKIE